MKHKTQNKRLALEINIKIDLADRGDAGGILDLQHKNLEKNLSVEEKKSGGFVTFEASLGELVKIIEHGGAIVARGGDEVVGYILSMDVKLSSKFPFFESLVRWAEASRYAGKPLKDYRYCILMQICIDKNYRGKGILERLHNEAKKRLVTRYDLGITEIAIDNSRSVRANIDKMEMRIIGQRRKGNHDWYVVIQDFRS